MKFQIVIYILLFWIPNISFGGHILKVKNNKILVTLENLDSDFVNEGDLFSIANKAGHIVGRAKILKFNSNRAILKFAGKAEKGYEIFLQDYAIPKNISENNNVSRYPANFYRQNNDFMDKDRVTKISTGQYVAGGVLGTLMGVGIGHAIQERYTQNGWIFTATQLGSGFMYGLFAGQGNEIGAGLSIISLIGFRIWELVDVWWLPSSHKTVLYKKENRFYVTPLYSYNNFSKGNFGLSLVFQW